MTDETPAAVDTPAPEPNTPPAPEQPAPEQAAAGSDEPQNEKERLHRVDRRNKELADRIKELESKLEAAPTDLAERLSGLEAKLKEETARAEALRVENVRKDIYERALEGVPPDRRAAAQVMLSGLSAGVDLNSIDDGQVVEVASKLRERLHKLDSTYLNPTFPGAVNSRGEVDWSRFDSWAEVPQELRRKCPQSVYEERFAGGGTVSARSKMFGRRS